MNPTILITGAAGNLGGLLAHWLAERRLLGVWREPVTFQLISTIDYLRASEAAIVKPGIRGIYHVGDEKAVTLQEFLDKACEVWNCRRPFRVPLWSVYAVASLCELFAAILKKPSPLTRDFITIGRVSHWGETKRAREELIPELTYRTLDDGLATL